ncbi:MAG: fluoride efflux transporter FluC [Ilumatobacteraceae bacterium]
MTPAEAFTAAARSLFYGSWTPIDPDLAPSDPGEHSATHRQRVPRSRRRRAQPDVLLAIALGGMVGATARFKLAEALPTRPGHVPWATLWTNLSGSFLLGFLLIVLLERFPPTRYVRPFVATGILGAYTTMSTLTVETALLVKDGHTATGLLYAIGSVVAGLLLAYAGIVAGRLTPQRHHHLEGQ